MPSASYPYAVGRIRVIEQSLLSEDKLKRLCETPRADFLRELNDLGFAAECPVRADVDSLVEWREKQVRDILEDVTPDSALTELFFLDTDATNLKLLIKARITGEQCEEYLQQGVFDIELLKKCVDAREYSALGEPLGSLVEQADFAPFEPAVLSAAIDCAVYTEIFARLKRNKNKFCSGYFTIKADCTNTTSALRGKKLGYTDERLARELVPGGKIPHRLLIKLLSEPAGEALSGCDAAKEILSAVESPNPEERVAGLLKEYGQQSAYDSFGIGPIVNFVVSALGECRTIRVAYARAKRVKI